MSNINFQTNSFPQLVDIWKPIVDRLDYRSMQSLYNTNRETRSLVEGSLSIQSVARFAQETEKCWRNRNFVCNAVAINGFNPIPEEFQSDLTILKTAFVAQHISENGRILGTRRRAECLQQLVNIGDINFGRNVARFQTSFSITNEVWRKEQLAFLFSYGCFQNDREVGCAAVERDGTALRYAVDSLRDDEDLVCIAVKQNGLALEYASDRLKNNNTIVSLALEQDSRALQYANERFRDDEKIVRSALERDGRALEGASDRLRDNEEFVRFAIERDARALKGASYRFRDDEEFVRFVIARDGRALEGASDRLRDNAGFIQFALERDGRALKGATGRFRDFLG